MAVSLANHPTATSTDLDGGGSTDYMLSFSIPFADLVSLAVGLVPGFNKSSFINYAALTGT